MGQCSWLGGKKPRSTNESEAGVGGGLDRFVEFTYADLERGAGSFRIGRLRRRGGFGRYYLGIFEIGQVLVKSFDLVALDQCLAEVRMYVDLNHPNIISMVGLCAAAPYVVFEYMPPESLDIYLHARITGMLPLSWNARMRIAAGVANGLYYLHTVSPPIICWDLRSSNILLGEGFEPKLTDFGLQRFEPPQDRPQDRTADLAYRAPEYLDSGTLTVKSDVYSFGVVLLEIITGRRPHDETRADGSRFLVDWVRGGNFGNELADPVMEGRFPQDMLNRVRDLALSCVSQDSESRPSMRRVARTMNNITSQVRRFERGESSGARQDSPDSNQRRRRVTFSEQVESSSAREGNADQGGQGLRVTERGESSGARGGETDAVEEEQEQAVED